MVLIAKIVSYNIMKFLYNWNILGYIIIGDQIQFWSIGICMPNGSSRCKNGGSCVIHENATVTCMCRNDYEGPFCGKSNIICYK